MIAQTVLHMAGTTTSVATTSTDPLGWLTSTSLGSVVQAFMYVAGFFMVVVAIGKGGKEVAAGKNGQAAKIIFGCLFVAAFLFFPHDTLTPALNLVKTIWGDVFGSGYQIANNSGTTGAGAN